MNTPVASPPIEALALLKINPSDTDSVQAPHSSVPQVDGLNAQGAIIYPGVNNLLDAHRNFMANQFLMVSIRFPNGLARNSQAPIRYPEPFTSGGALPHTLAEAQSLDDSFAALTALQGAPCLLPLVPEASDAEYKAQFLFYLGIRATWLVHFCNHFCLNKAHYTTGKEQISLFLSYLKGPIAGKWAERPMKEYDADQADNTIAPADKQWITMDAVINQFKLDFAALDPVTTACQMVETIRITGKLADFNKFITAFDTHTDESGFDEISLLHYFKKGLNPSLVDHISTLFPILINLADYKQCAVVMQNT
ncbi:hypothetical protein CPB85DRAFT_1445231 [Mucidula mucida]|nr:hypothetical protein CPB85DRAFT_1445231 [Mucidula mucida]